MLCYAMQNVYKKISGGGDGNDKGEQYGDAKKMTMVARQLSSLCGLRGSS